MYVYLTKDEGRWTKKTGAGVIGPRNEVWRMEGRGVGKVN